MIGQIGIFWFWTRRVKTDLNPTSRTLIQISKKDKNVELTCTKNKFSNSNQFSKSWQVVSQINKPVKGWTSKKLMLHFPLSVRFSRLKYIGDKFKMLMTDLRCWYTIQWIVPKLSSCSHQRHLVPNIFHSKNRSYVTDTATPSVFSNISDHLLKIANVAESLLKW